MLHKITCRDMVIIMLIVDRKVGRNWYHNKIESLYLWAFVGFSVSFPSFLSIGIPFISFSYLVALARAFSRMLKRNSGKELPCPDPDFSGKVSRFSLLERSICCRSSSYSLSIMKSPLCLLVYWAPVIASCQVPFPSTLIWRCDFSSLVGDVIRSITWLGSVLSALHPWDKFFLAVGDNSLLMLFWIHVLERCWSLTGTAVMSLSGVAISWCWLHTLSCFFCFYILKEKEENRNNF